ncbi:hypothetical protein AMELA_G00134310 [Ameiurus melas]|uniref:Uncharacterized protein n=1 Tax=Ameiurus melas TaxID=219545 RepID=A0A7J6AN51_AMEME|nr:hypothetical protein AMELA_G00134310 [Ameiurus melas]
MTLLSALGAGVAKLRLRPLMYTTGTAATAAAIYHYVKRGDGKKTTDPEVITEDPVCDQATEPALVQPIEVPQDQVMGAVRRAEEKIQKLVLSNTQLEDRVKELEELLCEARKECEREWEVHVILQSEYDEMKENLMEKEQLLKVSLAEYEEKHQKAVETIAQLEVENSDLKDQVETLQGRVQNMENRLRATEWECDKLMNDFHIEEEEMKKSVIHIVELLKVSLAEDEEKHQKAVETIAQLEVTNSDLKDQVETLQGRVQNLENLLIETQIECDELKKNTLMDKEELLKVSQYEDEQKPQKAVEIIAQLVMEKSNLIDQVETLRLRVWEMENLLHETYKWSADQMNECEREWEAHVILQSEYDEMKEKLMEKEQLLKVSLAEYEEKHQKAVETIAQLEVENSDLKDMENLENLLHATEWECDKLMNDFHMEKDEMKKSVIHIVESLKVSLGEDKEKHQKAVETIAQLEVEKSDLKDQVEILRLRVWEMENLLNETYRWSADQMNECEREREAYVILQSEYDDMKENLMDKEQLLNVSQSEYEQKPQKVVETIAQLVMEKSDLIDQVETLRLRVQEMENLHHETYRWSADQLNECEREWEAHVILQSKNDEMKENLMDKEQLLKEHGINVSSLIQGDKY